MPEAPLKVAVIGTGLIANLKHIPSWQKLAGKVDLACICDLNEEQAKKVAGKFGIKKVHTDFDAMLAEEKPDIVDICTPPKTHCFLAEKAADGGANVMIEKPMAMDVAECDRVIAARDRNNVQMMCCHSDLFYLSYTKARRMIEEGEIGRLTGMHIFLSTPTYCIAKESGHWANRLPGGAIGETGPHVVYMTLPFIPKVDEVLVSAAKLMPEYPWSPFEDYRIVLRGEGATCSITATYASDEWLAQVDFIGTDAILRLDIETQSLTRYTREDITAGKVAMSQVRQAGQLLRDTLSVGARYATGRVPSTHDVMCERFCACVAEGAPSPVPAEEGRETVRVLREIVDQLEAKYPGPLEASRAWYAEHGPAGATAT